MQDNFTPHEHYCELELFNRKRKDVWRENCPLGKRPKHPNRKDACDCCKHCIIVEFKDRDLIQASAIIRTDGEEVKK